jgi:hypothetical protein
MLDPLAPSTPRGTTQDKIQENKSLKSVDTINKGAIIGSTTTQTGQHKMTTARLYNAAKYQQVEGKKMILELSNGQLFNVKGSREANKICKELNAKPWNF